MLTIANALKSEGNIDEAHTYVGLFYGAKTRFTVCKVHGRVQVCLQHAMQAKSADFIRIFFSGN